MNAIELTNVYKRFRLYHYRTTTLRNLLTEFSRGRFEILEAVRGVTFPVAPGETVALVGRNGSGKSTLLRLMARIYRPNKGSVTVNGRLASMIEIEGGFHGELTGAENAELIGTIWGLRRREIARRIPAITAFAGLDRFIDAPIKTFSSGMIMRLGFAIAAHVDAQVLLIDEVLAVGDEEFQQKCYTHLEKMQREGTTIVFVSHDMNAVKRVARRTIWLDKGIVRADGATETVVEAYMREAHTSPEK